MSWNKKKSIAAAFLAVSAMEGAAGAYLFHQVKEELEENDFDPSDYYVDSNAEQLMSLIYEPLFVIDEKGNLKNGMADTVEIDEEERTIVIELRESYWSDDKRVEAKDFVYSWCRRLLDPNKVNPAATLLFDIENAVEARCATGGITIADVGAKATGIYELTITYREGADVDRLLRNLASVATAPARPRWLSSPFGSYWISSPVIT